MSQPPIEVGIRRLPHAQDLPLPKRASPGAAGFDLCAALEAPIELLPGKRTVVPTGFAFEIPPGWEGQVRPRSGLARRQGITIVNTPGTVDSDYRGEVVILLIHLGEEPYTIQRGERVAQIVFAPVVQDLVFREKEDLSQTERGDRGFGSTGRHG